MNSTNAALIINHAEADHAESWSNRLQNQSGITSRQALIIACYTAIVIVSLFGNSLVCSIVIRNARMRCSTYVFITNLALSDLMMTVLNIPFNVARLLLNNWPFGSFMCSFVPLMQVTFVYVSTFTMTCIAVDRYRVIRKPLRPRLRSGQAIKIMACVWVLAVLLSLPHAIFNKVKPIFTFRLLLRCRTEYPEEMSLWITLITVITQYILPLSVTGVLYCLITARVWSRNALGAVTEAQLVYQARAKRKTIKMLVFVVIFFALCWLPLNVFNILREFNQLEFIYKPSTTIFFICHWLAMSSVCYNPFIYCWLNEHFRSGAINSIYCIQDIGRKMNISFRSIANLKLINMSCNATTPTISIEDKFSSNQNSSTDQCFSKAARLPKIKSNLAKNGSLFLGRNVKIPIKSYNFTKTAKNGSLLKCLGRQYIQYNSAPNLCGSMQYKHWLISTNTEIFDFDTAGKMHPLKRCFSWSK